MILTVAPWSDMMENRAAVVSTVCGYLKGEFYSFKKNRI